MPQIPQVCKGWSRCTHHTVFLLILRLHNFSREFALFAHGHKRSAESHCNDGSNKEAPRVQAYDDINFSGGRLGDGMRVQPVHEVRDEGLKTDGIPEERENVQKDDPLCEQGQNTSLASHMQRVPSWASRGTASTDSSNARRRPWWRKRVKRVRLERLLRRATPRADDRFRLDQSSVPQSTRLHTLNLICRKHLHSLRATSQTDLNRRLGHGPPESFERSAIGIHGMCVVMIIDLPYPCSIKRKYHVQGYKVDNN